MCRFGCRRFHIAVHRNVQHLARKHTVGIFTDEHAGVGIDQCLYRLFDGHALRTDFGGNFGQSLTLTNQMLLAITNLGSIGAYRRLLLLF